MPPLTNISDPFLEGYFSQWYSGKYRSMFQCLLAKANIYGMRNSSICGTSIILTLSQAIYRECWIYNKICYPINQLELRLFISYMVNDSSFSRYRRHRSSKRCDSWGSFRSHRRKANGKMQIGDLFFSCASWIFFRRHKESLLAKDYLKNE